MDQFGLESNFKFAVSPGTLQSMQGIISQLQGIEKTIRETGKVAGRQNLGRTIQKVVGGITTNKKGADEAKKKLALLKGEFRALKAAAANIDYGDVFETGKFSKASKAVKEYTKSLEAMRSKIEGNSDAEREFAEVLKRQERVATDKLSMHKNQRDAAKSAQRVGEFGALAGAGKAVLTPTLGLAKEATQIFGDFDDKMAGVAAVSRASGKEMDILRKKAFALGASTRYTAAEAADAEGFLSSAGFNTEQILTGVGATLDLASAGALDLGAAADISSNVLSGMGLKVDDLTHVVDTLALVAADANTNIQQMGVAMSYAAPNAALFGASIEETAALMGVMSNAGIQADKAGTAMRGAFLKLAAPTAAGAAALETYKIALQDTHGNMKNVMDVMNDMAGKLKLDQSLVKGIMDAGDDEQKINGVVNTALREANKKAAAETATQADITKAQQIKALKDIFGTTGISGAAAALGSMQEANRMALAGLADSTSTKQIEKKINSKFGISKKKDDKDIFAATFAAADNDYSAAADIINNAVIGVTEDNLKKLNNGQIEQIREKLQIAPGQDILSTLQANSPNANAALSKLTSAMSQLNIEFKGVTGAGKQMAQTMENSLPGSFRSLSSAVEAVYIALIEPLAPFIRLVADMATKFALFIANLPTPIRIGIAVTAALTIGMAALAVTVGNAGMMLFGFSQSLATANAASTALSAGLIPLTGFFSTSMAGFTGTNPLDTFLGKGAKAAVNDFKVAFTGSSKEVIGGAARMRISIIQVSRATFMMAKAFATSPFMLWVGAIMLFNGLLSRVAPEFNIIGTVLSAFSSAAGLVVGFLEGMVQGIGDLLGVPAGELSNTLSAPFRVLSSAIEMAVTSFQAWEESGRQIGRDVTKFIGAPIVAVAGIINLAWTVALDSIANLFKPFADTVEYLGKWLQGTLEEPASKVDKAWGGAVGAILGNWNWLVAQAVGIRDAIVGMLNHGSADATLFAWERASVAISTIWLLMTGHATIAGTAISEVFKFAWGLIIAAAIQGTSAISNAWTNAVNGITGAWNWLVTQAKGIRDSIVNLLNHGSADATLSAWDRVSLAISSTWNWMVTQASLAGTAIATAFGSAFNFLGGQITNISGAITGLGMIPVLAWGGPQQLLDGWNQITQKKPEVLGPSLPDSPSKKKVVETAEPVKSQWDEFTGGNQTAAGAIAEAERAKSLFQRIREGAIGSVSGFVNEMVFKFTTGFESIKINAVNFLDGIFGEGTGGVIGDIATLSANMAGAALDAYYNFNLKAVAIGKALGAGEIDRWQAVNLVVKSFGGLLQDLVPVVMIFGTGFDNLRTKLGNFLNNIPSEGFVGFIKDIANFWLGVTGTIAASGINFLERGVAIIGSLVAGDITGWQAFSGVLRSVWWSMKELIPLFSIVKNAEVGWVHGAVEGFNMLGFAVLTAASMLMNLEQVLLETASLHVPALGNLLNDGIPKGFALAFPGAVAMMMSGGIFQGLTEGFMKWVNSLPGMIQEIIPMLYGTAAGAVEGAAPPLTKEILEGMGIQQQAMSDFFKSMTSAGREALYLKRVDAGMAPGMPADQNEYNLQRKVYEDQNKAFKAGTITEAPVPPQAPANAPGVIDYLNGVGDAVKGLEEKIKPIFELFAESTIFDIAGMIVRPLAQIVEMEDDLNWLINNANNIPVFSIPVAEFLVVESFLAGIISFMKSPSIKGIADFFNGPVREALLAVGRALLSTYQAAMLLVGGIPYFVVQQAIKNARAAAEAAGIGVKAAQKVAVSFSEVALSFLSRAEKAAEKVAVSFVETAVMWLRKIPYVGEALANTFMFVANAIGKTYEIAKKFGQLILDALPGYLEFAQKTLLNHIETAIKPLIPAFERVFVSIGAGFLYFYKSALLPLSEMLGYLLPWNLAQLYIKTKGFQGIVGGINVFDLFVSGAMGGAINKAIKFFRAFQNEMFPTDIVKAKLHEITGILANRRQRIMWERYGQTQEITGWMAQILRMSAITSPLIELTGRLALSWMFWFSILEPITPEMFKASYAFADWIAQVDKGNSVLSAVSTALKTLIWLVQQMRTVYVNIIPGIFAVVTAYFKAFQLISRAVKPTVMVITFALIMAYRAIKFVMSAIAIAVLVPVTIISTALQGVVKVLERIGNNFKRFFDGLSGAFAEIGLAWAKAATTMSSKGFFSKEFAGEVWNMLKTTLTAIAWQAATHWQGMLSIVFLMSGQALFVAGFWALRMLATSLWDGRKTVVPAAIAIGKSIIAGIAHGFQVAKQTIMDLPKILGQALDAAIKYVESKGWDLYNAMFIAFIASIAFSGFMVTFAGKIRAAGGLVVIFNKLLATLTMTTTNASLAARLLNVAFMSAGIGLVILLVYDAYHGFENLHKIMTALQQPMEWLKGAFNSLLTSFTEPVPFWLVNVMGTIAEKFVQFIPILLVGLFLVGASIRNGIGGGLEYVVEKVGMVLGGIMGIVRAVKSVPQKFANVEAPALEAIHKGRSKFGLYKDENVKNAREREYKLAGDANAFRDAIGNNIEKAIKLSAKEQGGKYKDMVETVKVKRGGFMGIGAREVEETRLTEAGQQFRNKTLAQDLSNKTGTFADKKLQELARSVSPDRLGKLSADQLREVYSKGKPDLQALSEAMELLDVNNIKSHEINADTINIKNGGGAFGATATNENNQNLSRPQLRAVMKDLDAKITTKGGGSQGLVGLSQIREDVKLRGTEMPILSGQATGVVEAGDFKTWAGQYSESQYTAFRQIIEENAEGYADKLNKAIRTSNVQAGENVTESISKARGDIIIDIMRKQLQSTQQAAGGAANAATQIGEEIAGEITRVTLPIRTGLFGVLVDTFESIGDRIKQAAGKTTRRTLATNAKISSAVVASRDEVINSLLKNNPVTDAKQLARLNQLREDIRNRSLDPKTASTKIKLIAGMIQADPYQIENAQRPFIENVQKMSRARIIRKDKFSAIERDRTPGAAQSRSDRLQEFKKKLGKEELQALEEGRFRNLGVYQRKNEKGETIDAPKMEQLAAILGYDKSKAALDQFERDFSTEGLLEIQKLTLAGKLKRFLGIKKKEENYQAQLQQIRAGLNGEILNEFRRQKRIDDANRETSLDRQKGFTAQLKRIGSNQIDFFKNISVGQKEIFQKFLKTGQFKRSTAQEDLVAMAKTLGFEGEHAVDDFVKFRTTLNNEQKAILKAYLTTNKKFDTGVGMAHGDFDSKKKPNYTSADAEKTLNNILGDLYKVQNKARDGVDASDYRNQIKAAIGKARSEQSPVTTGKTVASLVSEYLDTGLREFDVDDKEIAAIGRKLGLDSGGMSDSEVANLVRGIANLQGKQGFLGPVKRIVESIQTRIEREAKGVERTMNFVLKYIGSLPLPATGLLEKGLRTFLFNPLVSMVTSIWAMPGNIQDAVAEKAKELGKKARHRFDRLPGVRAFTGAGEEERRNNSLPLLMKKAGIKNKGEYQTKFIEALKAKGITDERVQRDAFRAVTNFNGAGIKENIKNNPRLNQLQLDIEDAMRRTLYLNPDQMASALKPGGLNNQTGFIGMKAERDAQTQRSLPALMEQAKLASGEDFADQFKKEMKIAGVRDKQAILMALDAVLSVSSKGLSHDLQNSSEEIVRNNQKAIQDALARTLKITDRKRIEQMLGADGLTMKAVEPWSALIAKRIIPAIWDLSMGLAQAIPNTIGGAFNAIKNFRQNMRNAVAGVRNTFLSMGTAVTSLLKGKKQKNIEKRTGQIASHQRQSDDWKHLQANPDILKKIAGQGRILGNMVTLRKGIDSTQESIKNDQAGLESAQKARELGIAEKRKLVENKKLLKVEERNLREELKALEDSLAEAKKTPGVSATEKRLKAEAVVAKQAEIAKKAEEIAQAKAIIDGNKAELKARRKAVVDTRNSIKSREALLVKYAAMMEKLREKADLSKALPKESFDAFSRLPRKIIKQIMAGQTTVDQQIQHNQSAIDQLNKRRTKLVQGLNPLDVTFTILSNTFSAMQEAVKNNQPGMQTGIRGFFAEFKRQLDIASNEMSAAGAKAGLLARIGSFFAKVGNFFKKLPFDAEHAQKVNPEVAELKNKRKRIAQMSAATPEEIARKNRRLASIDQRIQYSHSQQAITPALAQVQGLTRTHDNLEAQRAQSVALRQQLDQVGQRKPQTPQDIAATVSELTRLNAAIEAGDKKIARYEQRIDGVTASAGTMGDNLRRAALKIALAWENSGDKIENKVLRGLVKFSAPIGKKLVDLLNHHAADTVAAAWERTENSTHQNMQQMAHNADVAGAQIVENLGGAAQQVAQQAAPPPAEGAGAQAQRRMGILGHAGNVAKKGWKAGAAIGGAGMAAGFAGQGAVYSLSTLGVIDEEQAKSSDKFFQLFTLLSSITGLITPIAGAVAATFEAVVGAAMGAWAAISGLVAGLGALFTNPVTGFVGAVALALLVANWALKKFFNVDLGQYVTQFGMWMWGYVSKFGEWVAQPFIWAANAIKGAFSSAWKWVHDNLSEQIDPIISFMRPITDFMDKAVKQITGAWDGFVGRFQSMPLVESAKETATGLINALNHNPTEKIPNAWDGAADRIVNTLGSLPPEAQTTASQMNAAIIDSLGNISPEAQNMAKQVNAALGTMTPEQKKKMLADGMQSLASPFAKKDGTGAAVAAAAPTTQIGQLSQSVTELKDPTKDLKQAALKLKISATELKIAVTMMSLARSPFQLIESYKKAMTNPAAAAATTATSAATSVAQSTAYNRITGRPMPTATPLEAAQNAARLQQIENEKKGIARKEAMVKAFQTAQASATVALSNPITQAVLGVTAIIALVEALTPKFNLLGNLAAIIVAPFTFLKGIVGGLMEAFNIVLPPMTLKEDAEKYFQDVKATFLRVSAMIEGAGKNLGKSLGNFLIASTSRIQSAWQGFVDWFNKMPLVQFAKDIATGLINALNHNPTERIPEAWAGAAEKMKEYLGGFLKFAIGAASLIVGAFAFEKLTHRFTARTTSAEFLKEPQQKEEKRKEKIRGAIAGVERFSLYANVASDIAELSGIELPGFVDPLLKATTILGVFGDLAATVVPALSASLGGLFLPITAVIAAVGLIAIAWSQNLFGIQEKTAAVVAGIKAHWKKILIWFPAIGLIVAIWDKNLLGIKEKVSGAVNWIRGAWQGFVDWFGNMPLVKHALDIATGLINALNHNPTERIPEAWEGAVARIQEGLTGMMTFAQNIGQTLVDAFQGFGTTIQTNFDIATEAIKTTFSGISTSLSEAFTSATTTIQTSLEPLKEAFTGVGTSLSEAITGALTGVQTQFDTLTTSAGEMGTKIKNELTGTLDGVKTWLTDGVAGIFNFGQKPGATPEQYGPQLPPAAKPTESGFDFGKAWSDASSWASDQWPFKAQPEMLGPQLPPAPKAAGEEFDFNKAWSDASSWASQQWPFKATPEQLGPQLPPAGSANNIVPIALPSSGGGAPIVTAPAPVPSETEKLVTSLNAIRANPVNPIDDAGKTLAQIATQLTPANKADALKAELAQVQAQATATQVQVVTSAQQLEQDKKKAERWFAGADAKEQAKISEGTTLDLAQAFGAIDEKRLSLVAQLQEIKPRKRFFEDQGRERATEREAAKLGVKANEDKQVVAKTKLIAASLKLEEYRKKAGAGRIAAMRFGGDVVRTEKEVLSLVDAMATLGEQHEVLAGQVKQGAISGKAADVARMLGFDPDGLEVVAQSAKASVDKAVGEIQVGWQDRWNYMETVGVRGAGALFGPGIAEVKNSLKTLGGDFSDFAHRAGTALLKLDWVGFKAAASDFWGNLTFSLQRAASGFGSLAMSAGVFISFTLMHLPLIVVLFGTLAFGAFVLLTNFLGLRTILRGVFEIARGGLEFTIALVDGLLKSLKPINRIVKGLFKALKGDFSEVQAGITDLQYVWRIAFAKMATGLMRMGMGIKRIFQGVFEGIEQVSQPFADFLRKVGTKIEDVVWGFRLFIATIKDGGNAGELFAKLIIGGLKGITHFLWNLPGNLAKALGNMLAGAAEWADKFINKLLSPFNAIGDRIKAALGGEFNFVAFVTEMQAWGARFGEALLNGLTGSLSLIGKVFGGALDYAGKFITSFGATIASQFPPALVMAFADVEGTIRNCAANLFAPLVNACKELGNEINRGIREIATGVTAILADVFDFSEFTGKLEGFGARIESTFTETIAVFERIKGAIGEAFLAPLNKIEGAWSATFTKIEGMAGGLSRILPRFGKKFQGALSEASPGPTYWIRRNWAKTADFVVAQISEIQGKASASGKAITRSLSDTGRTLRNRLTGRPTTTTADGDDDSKKGKLAQSSRNAMLSVGSVLSNFAPNIATPLFVLNDFIDAFLDLKEIVPGVKTLFAGQAAAQIGANAAVAASDAATASAAAGAGATQVASSQAAAGASVTSGGIIGGINSFIAGTFTAMGAAASKAWVAITGPLLPVVAAIAALVVVAGLAYLAFQNNFLGIRDVVGGVWDGIVAVAGAVASVVTGVLGGIWNEIAGIFQTFDKEMKHLWAVIVEVGGLLMQPFQPLVEMFGGKGGTASGWLGAAVKGLVGLILLPVKLIAGAINLVIKAISLVVEVAIRLGGVLSFFILGPAYRIAGAIQSVASTIGWVGQTIWSALVAPFQFLQNLVADIWGTVSELPNKIGEAVAKVPGGQFMLNVAGRFFGGGGQAPAKYATGGYVSGPGSGTADKVPAFLSNGEFVINAGATAQNLGLLEALNSGTGIVPVQVLPMLPPVAIPQIVMPSSAPAEATPAEMPPIEININLNGNIVLGSATTAEQAQEFLAKIDPYLRQSIHAYLRDAVDFSR